MLKPRIRWNTCYKCWICVGGGLTGYGYGVDEALGNWKFKRDMHHP